MTLFFVDLTIIPKQLHYIIKYVIQIDHFNNITCILEIKK